MLRFCIGGVLILPSKTIDPTGVNIIYQGNWKVWNLWFSPIKMEVSKQSCSCLSAKIENGSLKFGRSTNISIDVSAVHKSQDFTEKALLEIVRGRKKMTKILSVNGQGFAGLFFWPDAIIIPENTQYPYSELVTIKFHNNIKFNEIGIKIIGKTNIQTEWISKPVIDDYGIYYSIKLKVNVMSTLQGENQIIFSIKDIAIKDMRIYSLS